MTDLTPTESRALARDGRVTVVRPMEKQGWTGFSQDVCEPSIFYAAFDGDRPDYEIVEAPHCPDDTLADGARVVSVEPMRFDDLELNAMQCGFSHGAEFLRYWNETYGHRPDWRYEANPWCWVMGVER